MAKTMTSLEKMSYEQALAELEVIVEKLENQPLGLDDTLSQFERGKALIQHCQTLLENAELKVRQLSADSISKELKE